MDYEIDKKLWHECRLCKKTIKDLAILIGGNGKYYTQIFKQHIIESHNISIEDYFQEVCERPKCRCGICNQFVDIAKKNGTNFRWKNLKCGLSDGVKKWSKEAKISRTGIGNPMYKKKSWNNGLNKKISSSMASISKKMTNRIVKQETKKKQSESAKKRTINGHIGYQHSEDNKNKFRQNTLQMIKDGKFSHTKTKPSIEFGNILLELDITYITEKIVGYWSFDYYLPEYDVYIEVDGDYFHSNPKIYPKGPKTKTQKINNARDISKNNYCKKYGLLLGRFWESDILNNRKGIICRLNELLLSKKSG